MPRLVHRRHAQVIPRHGAVGHGVSVDVAAVGDVDRWRGAGGDLGGEGAGSQVAAGEVRVEVEVQVGVGSLAEGGFGRVHVCACGDGPGVVDGEVGVLEDERDAVLVVHCVHCCQLGGRHVGGDGAVVGGAADDVEVGGDGDGVGDLFLDHVGRARAALAVLVAVVQVLHRLEEVLRGVFGFGAAAEVSDRLPQVGVVEVCAIRCHPVCGCEAR